MAEVTNNEGSHNKRSLHNKRRLTRNVRVDLTPMVDLAFLLITFFMLTTVMNEPKSMLLNQPADPNPPANVRDCQVLSILIDSNATIYTYEGLNVEQMQLTSFNVSDGIRQVILEKAKRVKAECGLYEGKPRQIICLIKLLPGAKYQSMVNVLDEMEITDTQTYAIQDPLAEEMKEVVKQEKLLADN